MGFNKLRITVWLVLSVFAQAVPTWAGPVLSSWTALTLELVGFNALEEISLFKGDLQAGGRHEIDTPYRGLALLVFSGGQRYPVLLDEQSFTVRIAGADMPPSFVESAANDFFYKALTGTAPIPEQYSFAHLMIQAKELLEQSRTIGTVPELTAMKDAFQAFVGTHYLQLQHSDMIRRLLAQYFMMHEYADYHIAGAPASDIRERYQKEVVSGVGGWLAILKPFLPQQEILNYCVSLYYQRSMVTLASLISDRFNDVAFCDGGAGETIRFPADLRIVAADGTTESALKDFKGKKLIAFVSAECPVSMVATVNKARQQKTIPLIVAPVEKLAESHLAMAGMVRNGNMYFINDDKWRTDNLAKGMKLPFFVLLGSNFYP